MTKPLPLAAAKGALILPWFGSAQEALAAAEGQSPLWRLRGSRMRTRTGLLEEWCTATPFPDYFGGTWDALRDALSDLPEGGTFLVLEADQLLQEALPTEFQTLVAVLRDVQEDLDPKPFRLVLQVAPDRYETLVEGLRGLGLL